MTPADFTSLLDNAGTLGAVVVALIAFWRGWIVRGTEFERMVDERDRALVDRDKWQDIAFRSIQVGERVTTAIEARGP